MEGLGLVKRLVEVPEVFGPITSYEPRRSFCSDQTKTI